MRSLSEADDPRLTDDGRERTKVIETQSRPKTAQRNS
jgi:hypothetical protein